MSGSHLEVAIKDLRNFSTPTAPFGFQPNGKQKLCILWLAHQVVTPLATGWQNLPPHPGSGELSWVFALGFRFSKTFVVVSFYDAHGHRCHFVYRTVCDFCCFQSPSNWLVNKRLAYSLRHLAGNCEIQERGLDRPLA